MNSICSDFSSFGYPERDIYACFHVNFESSTLTHQLDLTVIRRMQELEKEYETLKENDPAELQKAIRLAQVSMVIESVSDSYQRCNTVGQISAFSADNVVCRDWNGLVTIPSSSSKNTHPPRHRFIEGLFMGHQTSMQVCESKHRPHLNTQLVIVELNVELQRSLSSRALHFFQPVSLLFSNESPFDLLAMP